MLNRPIEPALIILEITADTCSVQVNMVPNVITSIFPVASVGFDCGVNLPAFADFGFCGVDDDHAPFVSVVFHDLDLDG